MGVSFKVGKVGTRYSPKVVQVEDAENENVVSVTDTIHSLNEGNFTRKGEKSSDDANLLAKSGLHLVSEGMEVSFSLNLFSNGFSVGKASELFSDVPKQLYPYDRASKTFFTAIEYGWLPGDIFDNISCKYISGALLCEIRDYRNCLYKRGIASVDKSPVIHKVLLQMCMENVIKDISLLTNDSWTYKDLLEVESRILKALQPDLHLNPQPFGDRFCGEPMTKKLDLGITWGWKKRKLTDASASNLRFSSQHNRGVPSSQLTISGSIPNLQKHNVMLETTPQPNPLMMGPKYQFLESCSRSALADLTASNLSSVPTQCFSERNSVMRETTTLVLSDQGTCETEDIQRPIIRIPKPEPLDFSQQQPTGSQPDIALAAKLLQKQKNALSHWKPEAERVPHERFHGKRGLPQLINSAQQAVLEGIPKLHAGMPTTVKQEPVETSNFYGLDVKKIKDNYIGLDMRNNRSNLLHLQLQRSLAANITPSNSPWNQMTHDQNARKEVGTPKRKALQNPRVIAGVSIAPVSYNQNESVQREASVPAKRKKNSRPKDLGTKISDSLAVFSNPDVTSAIRLHDRGLECPASLQYRNIDFPQTSGVKGDLERFLKIEEVTRRYGLKNRKRILENISLGKRSFPMSQLVAVVLNSEDNGRLEKASKERIPQSKCFADRSTNLAKTRTLKFVHRSHVQQGNEIPMVDSKACLKLVMSKKFNEGFVEASVICGREGIDYSYFPLLPTFPSTVHRADLFAAQFTSLMVREGCCLVSESMEPQLFSNEGCSSTQQRTVTGSTTQAGEALEQPTSSLMPPLSTSMLTSMTDGTSAINFGQLPSKTRYSGGHLPPSGSVLSTQQLSGNNLSKLQLEIATQLSPAQQHWHQIKHAQLQFQVMQRQRQQNQLMQQKLKQQGDLGAAVGGLGMVHMGGGIQGLGNIGRGSFSNVMGYGGSIHVPMGGQIPWINNVGQFNNIGSNVTSSNDGKQHFGGISDNAGAALAKPRAADGQGKALMGRYQFLGNTGIIPTQPPNIQDMAYLLSNQQFLPQNQLQQEMRSVLQPTEVNSLVDEYVGSPPSQVCSMSSLQLSSGSVLKQMNRNMMFGPESSELSTWTHGSVASSSASTSRNLCSFSKDKGTVKTNRV